MTFTNPEITSIVIIYYSSSFLNLVGSLFTVITFLLFKEARNTATYLILALALADLCTAFASTFLWVYLVKDEDNLYCKIQAGMQMFGLSASVIWGLFIGIYLFLALYKDVDLEYLGRFKVLFHVMAWGYAGLCTAIPYFENQYGIIFPQHKWTWCGIQDPQSAYRALLYTFDMSIFAILILFYYLIRRRLQRAHNSAAKEICKKMNIYLLTYAIINLFAIVNRIQNFFSSSQIYELYLLQFLTQPLQGFMNAIAYVWNEPIFIEEYKRLFSRCFTEEITILNETEDERERLRALVIYEGSCELLKPEYGSVNN